MIVTAGLTPAWQQIMSFEEVRPGEVNRASQVHWCASGKVLNVAIALANLGAQVRCVTLLGGTTGALIEKELSELRIEGYWAEIPQATRVCTTLLDRQNGVTTELVENAAPLSEPKLAEFVKMLERAARDADVLVLTGSTPQNATPGLLVDFLKQNALPTILDIRGPELIASLAARPLVVKPNREELEHTLGRVLAAPTDLHAAMRELNERGAEWALVSQGRGALWASSRGRLYRAAPPEVDVMNPIGSGDSLAAGIAWGIQEGKEPLEAIRYGMAAAADNVSQLLPARISRERVLALAEKIKIERC